MLAARRLAPLARRSQAAARFTGRALSSGAGGDGERKVTPFTIDRGLEPKPTEPTSLFAEEMLADGAEDDAGKPRPFFKFFAADDTVETKPKTTPLLGLADATEITPAVKPERTATKVDSKGRVHAIGRRKTASARVFLGEGTGEFVVNKKSLVDYFHRESHITDVLMPFKLTNSADFFDVRVTVRGGGHSGQAGAVRHAVARALNLWNREELRIPLKRAGMLTRDPRMVERKKTGQPKARKKKQWVKR